MAYDGLFLLSGWSWCLRPTLLKWLSGECVSFLPWDPILMCFAILTWPSCKVNPKLDIRIVRNLWVYRWLCIVHLNQNPVEIDYTLQVPICLCYLYEGVSLKSNYVNVELLLCVYNRSAQSFWAKGHRVLLLVLSGFTDKIMIWTFES